MKMRQGIIIIILLSILGGSRLHAQVGHAYSAAGYDSLRTYEMQLWRLSDSILDGSGPMVRASAHRKFIPLLKKALKVKGSFDYPFDSLVFMKKLVPEDKSFRIFNWMLKFEDGTFHYVAAIQMNTKDSLKLIPLYDKSEKLDDSEQTVKVYDSYNWFGALYTAIIDCKIKSKKYYVLLGWNGYNVYSDEKIIDVLSFDKEGKVQLGAPIFDLKGKIQTRVVFQYNGEANFLLNYVPEHKIISFDHLVPPNPKMANKPYMFVPDGSYDYFIFKKKKWVLMDDLFGNVKDIKAAGEGSGTFKKEGGEK